MRLFIAILIACLTVGAAAEAGPLGARRALVTAAADRDVQLWVGAVYANGGTVSSAHRGLLSRYIRAEKAAGVWSKRDDVLLLRAENDIQSRVSLKRRVLATATGSPVFVPLIGWKFNGSSNYLRTGYIPTTHHVNLTVADAQVTVWEATNLASANEALGAVGGSGQIYIAPRSGSNGLFGTINTGSQSVGTVTDSTGYSSIYRGQGAVFGGYKNGSSVATASPSPVSFLPSFEIYIGAYNNAGTAAGFRASTLSFAAYGGSLTAAQEAASYANISAFFAALPALDLYISSVSVNGIGIGNNTTGSGEASAPLLDCATALTVASQSNGATIWVNGTSAGAPDTYTCPLTTLTKPMMFRSVTGTKSVILAGTGTSRAFLTTAHLAVRDVIVDPGVNSGGAANDGILLTSQTAPINFSCKDSTIRNWGFGHYLVQSGAGDYNGNITMDNCVVSATNVAGGMAILSWGSGRLTISGGSCTLVDQNTSPYGCAVATASVCGAVTGSVTNYTVSVTPKIAYTGTLSMGVRFKNMVVAIAGGTYTHGYPGSGGPAGAGFPVGISQGRITDPVACSVAGSSITGVTISTTLPNGGGITLGDDNADKTLATGVSATGNTISALGHGLFVANTTLANTANNTISAPTTAAGSICLVDKGNDRFTSTDDTSNNCTSSNFLGKGSVASTWIRPRGTQGAGYDNGRFYSLGVGDDNNTGVNSTVTMTGANFTNNGATGTKMGNTDAGSTITPSNGTYTLSGGSLANPIWTVNGGSYASSAAYKAAVEAGATTVGF